jgi:hypothetical protein
MKKDIINPDLEVGDRVVCINMHGEASSVSYKDRGTVTGIGEGPGFIQYRVDWDNGSSLALLKEKGDEEQLDKWMLEDDFESVMSKRKKVNESNTDLTKKVIKNADVFRNFDTKFLFSYLEKLRESGITNMFGASPYLYMGSQRISHDNVYNESKDEEAFDELVEMADDAKDKMIQGAVKVLEKEGKEITVESVSRVIKRYSSKVLDMWMTTYH